MYNMILRYYVPTGLIGLNLQVLRCAVTITVSLVLQKTDEQR